MPTQTEPYAARLDVNCHDRLDRVTPASPGPASGGDPWPWERPRRLCTVE